jgi:hypothetical protein
MNWSDLPKSIQNRITIRDALVKKWKMDQNDEDEKPFTLISRKEKEWVLTKKGEQFVKTLELTNDVKKLRTLPSSDTKLYEAITDFYYDVIIDGIQHRWRENINSDNENYANWKKMMIKHKLECMTYCHALFTKTLNLWIDGFAIENKANTIPIQVTIPKSELAKEIEKEIEESEKREREMEIEND